MQRSAETIESFSRNDRFFIKSFLLDDSRNVNNWRVTDAALERDIKTFVGKPFVVTPEFDHPRADLQEQYRKGTIIDAGIDYSSGKAYAVAEITDALTAEQIKRGEIQFVSPSVGAEEEDVQKDANTGSEKITIKKFMGYHLAGVKKPAFGIYKAQIKGQCTGSQGVCTNQLRQVQASTSSALPTFTTDSTRYTNSFTIPQTLVDYSASEMGSCIDEAMQAGKERDQAIAYCTNKLGKNAATRKIDDNSSRIAHNSQSSQMDNDAAKSQQLQTQQQAAKTVVDYTAQIEAMNASLEAMRKENDALKLQYEAAIKRPHIERILSAKVELGEIKATDKESEFAKLSQLAAENLQYIASTLESAVKVKKDSIAAVPADRRFRLQVNASEERGKYGDEWLSKFRSGIN